MRGREREIERERERERERGGRVKSHRDFIYECKYEENLEAAEWTCNIASQNDCY